MGLIYWWSRLASRVPNAANFFMQTPPMSTLIKLAGGISTKRRFPKFANQIFREWFIRRGTKNQGRPKVILWADTFNNYFYPEVAIAGVEALEANGYQVYVRAGSCAAAGRFSILECLAWQNICSGRSFAPSDP